MNYLNEGTVRGELLSDAKIDKTQKKETNFISLFVRILDHNGNKRAASFRGYKEDLLSMVDNLKKGTEVEINYQLSPWEQKHKDGENWVTDKKGMMLVVYKIEKI